MRIRFGIAVLCLLLPFPVAAQQHELGFQLGRMAESRRDPVRLGTGTSLQFNYAYRLLGGGKAALYGETHFLANPQRLVGSTVPAVTRDVATIFLTPGMRLKLLPGARVSPYAVAGGGWAVFEQSTMLLNGQANSAPRTVNKGVFTIGGGVDVRVLRRLSLRGEVRDFFSGTPAYNVASLRGGQHNVVVSGGFVLNYR